MSRCYSRRAGAGHSNLMCRFDILVDIVTFSLFSFIFILFWAFFYCPLNVQWSLKLAMLLCCDVYITVVLCMLLVCFRLELTVLRDDTSTMIIKRRRCHSKKSNKRIDHNTITIFVDGWITSFLIVVSCC